ncbi:MAG: HIT family protein [Lachnospiraceae bacterium]|nr:HIT family protein [Lachnospiraceae bacterium]
MYKDDCIFCKIIKGEIPSYTIYEDDAFKVILDAGPVSKGHALILPKDHYDDLYELPEDKAAEAFKLAKKLMGVITEKLRCDGFNICQNNGEAADQTVKHFHMHLVPRYNGGQKFFAYTPLKLTPEEQNSIKEKITT